MTFCFTIALAFQTRTHFESLRKKFTMKPTPDIMPDQPKTLPESVQAELAVLAGMTDEDIDCSDIPATTHEDWIGAVRGKIYRPVKQITQEAN